MTDGGSDEKKDAKVNRWLALEAVIAAAVASFICWRWDFSWFGGKQGLHGDWSSFFLAAFVPLALITLTKSGDVKWSKPKVASVKLVAKLVLLTGLLLVLGVSLYQLAHPPTPPKASPEELQRAERELREADEQVAKAQREVEAFEKAHGIRSSAQVEGKAAERQ